MRVLVEFFVLAPEKKVGQITLFWGDICGLNSCGVCYPNVAIFFLSKHVDFHFTIYFSNVIKNITLPKCS